MAPAQHELAPIFATTNTAIDQNLLTMEYMKKVAERHGLVCLLHEKPYAGVNGSGKHNNWSLSANGKNLLDPGKTPGENLQFLLILAAIVKAVDDYQDLMRLSVAYAGNDHRLGANEAPPAIVSIFLGEELTAVIDSIVEGKDYKGADAHMMNLGIPTVPVFRKDTTDRNRTSPFAFTGNKFEFRMPGSSQNLAMPNTVLNTAVAESFRLFADELEGAKDLQGAISALIRRTFRDHRRILFDGNGYSDEWKNEAKRRGLLNLENSVEAYKTFLADKNVALFAKHGVMNRVEMQSREEIYFENYAKVINIEALTMIEMASRSYIPAVEAYIGDLSKTLKTKLTVCPDASCKTEKTLIETLSAWNDEAFEALENLKTLTSSAASNADVKARAEDFCYRVVPAMNRLRVAVDQMESLTSSDRWPFPSYSELMFKI